MAHAEIYNYCMYKGGNLSVKTPYFCLSYFFVVGLVEDLPLGSAVNAVKSHVDPFPPLFILLLSFPAYFSLLQLSLQHPPRGEIARAILLLKSS